MTTSLLLRNVRLFKPVTVKFVDDENCYVYLPDNVDGLALPDPSSYKSQKIITREKTPYISQSKFDIEHEDELERRLMIASSVRNPAFTSSKKELYRLGDQINGSDPAISSERQAGDLNHPSNFPQTDTKTWQTSQNQPPPIHQSKLGVASREGWDRSQTDFKLSNAHQTSHSPHKHLAISQGHRNSGYSAQNPEEDLDGSGYINVNCSEDAINEDTENRITMNLPESIVEHVKAVRDPDPENKEKMFRQYFMDDNFKQQYGTKLAVTPNKRFGNQDSAEVKKGSWINKSRA